MRKYWLVFKINLQKSFEYRSDFLGHLGGGIITFVVMYFIWSAVFRERSVFNGYTFSSMMTYVLFTRFLHFTMRGNTGRQIAAEIKEGKLSAYLLKPINYLKWWFFVFLADRGFEFLIRFFMLVSFLGLMPKLIVFQGFTRLFLFLLTVLIAVLINFLINLLIASLTFWLTDVRLFRSTIMMIIDFLAGATVPIDVLPKFLRHLSFWLPFQFVAFFPIKVYQGTFNSDQFLPTLVLMFFWILTLLLAVNVIWQKGIKRYEAIGQ